MPDVSIIVPHYNDTARLTLCLRALRDQLPLDGRDVEILVCDNASTQSLDEVRAEFGDLARFVAEPRSGAAHARNAGVAASQGEVLLFTDADCIPEEGWIRELTAFVDAHDYCGGRIEVFSEAQGDGFNPYDGFERIFAFRQHLYVREQNYAATANMGVRRATFDRVGPFDNESGEDIDWGQRAFALGIKCAYAERAAVRHPTRPDWGSLWRKWRRLALEDYQTRRKNGASGASLLGRAALIALSPFWHVREVLSHADLSVMDRLSVAGVLFRLRFSRAAYFSRLVLTGRAS